MISPSKTFLRGSAASLLATIVIGLVGYFTRRTMALSLDQDLYGFFYSAFSLCMLIVIFIDLGFNQSATILMSKHLAHEKYAEAKSTFWTFTGTKLVTGILSALALFALSDFLIRNFFHYPGGTVTLHLFSFFLVATALTGTISATLDAMKRFAARNALQTGGALMIFIGVYAGVNEFPLQAPVIAYTVSAILLFSFGLLLLRRIQPFLFSGKTPTRFRISLKEFWVVGRWITLATASMSAMYYMDTIMLTYFSDLQSVALYNIALPVLAIYQSLLIFPLIFTPIASELWQKNREEELKSTLRKINTWGIFILLICAAVLYIFPVNEIAVSILFSPDFKGVAPALNILCIGVLFLGLGQIYSNTLMAIDRPKTVAKINSIAVVVNILANVILIPRFNIVGAAMATALSYILITLGCGWSLKKALGSLKPALSQ